MICGKQKKNSFYKLQKLKNYFQKMQKTFKGQRKVAETGEKSYGKPEKNQRQIPNKNLLISLHAWQPQRKLQNYFTESSC